jgi:hypothetical protein
MEEKNIWASLLNNFVEGLTKTEPKDLSDFALAIGYSMEKTSKELRIVPYDIYSTDIDLSNKLAYLDDNTLRSLALHPYLTKLNLSSNVLSRNNIRIIATSTTIKTLNLSKTCFEGDELKEILKNTAITDLDISYNYLSSGDLKYISNNKTLLKLDISNRHSNTTIVNDLIDLSKFTDEMYPSFVDIINTNLEYLKMDHVDSNLYVISALFDNNHNLTNIVINRKNRTVEYLSSMYGDKPKIKQFIEEKNEQIQNIIKMLQCVKGMNPILFDINDLNKLVGEYINIKYNIEYYDEWNNAFSPY